MDVLKAQLARMQQQLGALSASQKMLAFTLVAMMVLTLLYWGRYAGTADMEPVLEQALKQDEISRITAQIAAKGVPYKVVGERILVPADRKLEVLADISYRRLAPQDTKSAYDEIIKRINPWSSNADNEATRNEAKSVYLAQVIRKFPGVVSADVMIDPTNQRRIGGGARLPTASVLIITEDPKDESNDADLVKAAVATVSGAHAGLVPSQVKVVVNGKPHRTEDGNNLSIANGNEILKQQQTWEQWYSRKVTDHFGYVDGILVAITCDLNISSEQSVEESYDPTKGASKEKSSETETREETSPSGPVGEPGAATNTGMSLQPLEGTSSAASGGSNSERNRTEFENRFGVKKVELSTPAGHAKPVRAAVRIPRSFFVNGYKSEKLEGATPDVDPEALKAYIAQLVPGIRADVKNCTGIAKDENISVEAYFDTAPLMAAATNVVGSASKAGGIGGVVGGHVKEIGIAGLALVSLFMLSSMVKKSSPAPVLPAPIELSESPMLVGGEDVAGDVGEGNATLDGMELDEDAVKAQQMVEQVATMVKENPDGAANLVKRWLNRA